MNQAFVERLEWSHGDEFRATKLRDWSVLGVAGQTKSAGNLTFATIYEAGHMVRIEDFIYLQHLKFEIRCHMINPLKASQCSTVGLMMMLCEWKIFCLQNEESQR
jgi:hypothetical protein